jgi:hypothetical protein
VKASLERSLSFQRGRVSGADAEVEELCKTEVLVFPLLRTNKEVELPRCPNVLVMADKWRTEMTPNAVKKARI